MRDLTPEERAWLERYAMSPGPNITAGEWTGGAVTFTLQRMPVFLPVSQDVLDDAVGMVWWVLRILPGGEREAMAARKRMLEMGMREGRFGPRGKLP